MTLLFFIITMFSCSDQAILELSNQQLNQDEIDGLLLMREEEKLARDVYIYLGDKWNKQIFSNISMSEQTHMDAVKKILVKYEIDDPIRTDEKGVFTSQVLQKLYDELTVKGAESLIDALTVGATIEDLDINDLNSLIIATQNTDLTTLYNNLNRGSRNHIRAFTKQLNKEGETYVPQFISQSEYDAIINSEKETGYGKAKNKSGEKDCGTSSGCKKGKGKKGKCKNGSAAH